MPCLTGTEPARPNREPLFVRRRDLRMAVDHESYTHSCEGESRSAIFG
jgi:hypothetical protein